MLPYDLFSEPKPMTPKLFLGLEKGDLLFFNNTLCRVVDTKWHTPSFYRKPYFEVTLQTSDGHQYYPRYPCSAYQMARLTY